MTDVFEQIKQEYYSMNPQLKYEISSGYEYFKETYNPNILKSLNGEELLNKMFLGKGDNENLCYYLEKDRRSKKYGSIGGRNAAKFGLYYSKDNNSWVKGKGKSTQTLSVDEAINEGSKIRDTIVDVCKFVSNLKFDTIEDYKKIDEYKDRNPFIQNVWVRKYLHMMFPVYFPLWYNTNMLDAIIQYLGEVPEEGVFAKAGQIAMFAKKCNIPLNLFSSLPSVVDAAESVKHLDWTQDDTDKDSAMKQIKNIPLNQILYGPPGTGKTYNTVIECVHILNNDLYNEYLNSSDKSRFYKDNLLPEYNRLREQGIIEFITFHQSYSYEEFVEGIKPQISEWSSTDGDDVKYIGKDGIFKVICRDASKPTVLQNKWDINSDVSIWKVSLGGTYDNPIREDCFKNNRIRIGWDKYGEHYEDEATEGKRPLDAFYQKMKKGDIVLSCYTNRIIDGIGIVEGNPVFDTSLSEYKRTRNVNWILKNIREDIFSINDDTTMTLPAVYKLKIPLNKIIEILHKYNTHAPVIKENSQKFVLVIDEINRGNISKIFGELITLIEEDKRSNLSVRLPYSQETLTVPKNLYIIGTMNTSDRSIATIDIALRRRFTFIPKMPDENLVPDKFNMKEAFKNLNKKIRILLDEDHQIGHSYFMNIETISDLKETWANKIIPLLNEYFYGDWTKLRLLIPGFISENPIEDKELEDEIGENCYYRFKNPFSLSDDDFIKATMGRKIETDKD